MLGFIVFTVVCGLVVSTPAERQKREAVNNCLDAFKNVQNPCANNPNSQVYFPHPSDVTKFIQCDRYGRMYIIQCPEQLVYSTAVSRCRQQAVATLPTQPAAVVSTVATGGVSSSNPCTPQALAAGQIYFAVPGDSSRFIECDMMGGGHVLACASGLIWSEPRLSCVYQFNAGGGTTTRPATGTGIGTGTGTGTGSTGNLGQHCTKENISANKLFFPHPDPTKFIQCDLWGDVFVVSCPAGLVWNQYSETCASAFTNTGPTFGK